MKYSNNTKTPQVLGVLDGGFCPGVMTAHVPVMFSDVLTACPLGQSHRSPAAAGCVPVAGHHVGAFCRDLVKTQPCQPADSHWLPNICTKVWWSSWNSFRSGSLGFSHVLKLIQNAGISGFFSSKGVTCKSWLLCLFNSYCKLLFLSFLSIFLGPALRQLLRSFLSCYFISYVGQRKFKVPLLGFIPLKL